MDHTHCFTCGAELTRTISNIDQVQESVVYGLFPEFHKLMTKDAVLATTDTLCRTPREYVEDAIGSIPPEWQVNAEAKAALADFAKRRADYVAEHIMDWIWPQSQFDFTNPAEGKP